MPHPLVVKITREDCDVYIGRPSMWGNPFIIGRDGNRAEVIEKYRHYLEHDRPDLIESAKKMLPGKKLGCYCAPLPCHGDILGEIANGTNKT